jgi:hypothetical protein
MIRLLRPPGRVNILCKFIRDCCRNIATTMICPFITSLALLPILLGSAMLPGKPKFSTVVARPSRHENAVAHKRRLIDLRENSGRATAVWPTPQAISVANA